MPSQDSYNYTLTKKTTLAASAEVITLQQPASSARNVHLHSVSVESVDVDLDVTVERNGTAATATTLAPVGELATTPTSAALGWSGSDAGVGTVIRRFKVLAGTISGVDLSDVWMLGTGTGNNISIRTVSATGDVIVTLTYGECLPAKEAQ